jgi:hypothetical protein
MDKGMELNLSDNMRLSDDELLAKQTTRKINMSKESHSGAPKVG